MISLPLKPPVLLDCKIVVGQSGGLLASLAPNLTITVAPLGIEPVSGIFVLEVAEFLTPIAYTPVAKFIVAAVPLKSSI